MKKIQLLKLKEGAEINFSANTQNHTNEESDHYMKQTVKASVFEDLFSNKEYLLQLYQALHPEDTTALESDLERLFYFFQTKRLRFDEIGISRTRIICSIYWFQNN